MKKTAGKSLVWIAFGIFLAVCFGILAIDKFVVKRDAPSKDDRLQALVAEFGLSEGTSADRTQLLEILATLPGGIEAVETVVYRADDQHRLWLFEFDERKTAFYRTNKPDSTIDVTLFGVLFELKGDVNLPAWSQAEDAAPPVPPFTLASMGVFSRLSDYRMAMNGNSILFTTAAEGWALKQVVDQRQSVEFHPGLFNSAMKVDVQVAVDVVNALDTGLEPLPRFYVIDVPEINIQIPQTTGISNRLNKVREDMNAELEALRVQREADNERIRAENSARMKAAVSNMSERIKQHAPPRD